MATSNFNKLAKASEKKRDILTKKLKKEINSMYQGIYRELKKKRSNMPLNASESYLRTLEKELGKEIVKINKEILTITKDSVKEAGELGTSMQLDFFSGISNKNDLGIDDAIWNMCAKIHTDVVAEVLNGKIYKDRLGISERIWSDTKRFKKDIDQVISEGIAQKKGTYEIAKDLEKYLNPNHKEAIYNGVRGQANYNTYRIAHTSVVHAYQQAAKRSSQKNPYIEGMKWISSHDKKTCEICNERDGKVYKVKDLPLDHPMGRCTFTYEIPMSLEDIGTELSEWRNGEPNPKLDNWFKDYGKDFIPKDGVNQEKYKSKKKNNINIGEDFNKFESEVNEVYDNMSNKFRNIYDRCASKSIKNTDSGAYYRKGSVYMDKKDKDFVSVFFHEQGHAIDDNIINAIESMIYEKGSIEDINKFLDNKKNNISELFLNKKSFDKDFDNFLKLVNPYANGEVDDSMEIDFYMKFNKSFGEILWSSDFKYSGISDNINAITKGEYRGVYGHGAEYFSIEGNMEAEIFANLFQANAQNDKEVIEMLEFIMPNTVKDFNKAIDFIYKIENKDINKIVNMFK